MAISNLKTASVLAFERKLSNSDAMMHSGNWKNRNNPTEWQPIVIQEKAVRGTISNRLKNAIQSDPAKLDAEVQKANLQRVDNSALPSNADTLKVSFTLKVLGNLSTPSACNNQDYQAALADKIKSYSTSIGFSALAARYAENIANGRFLWRNRVGAQAIEVHVIHENDTWVFNSNEYSIREFSSPKGDLAKLAEVIKAGLEGDGCEFLKINAFVLLGESQEIYPSQELILDNSRDNDKSKTLYQVAGVAAMHSQKIGNALRTIDTWYSDDAEFGPIAIEPFGSVTNRGTALRQPKEKKDFYTLLDNWVLKDKAPSEEQQHYVIATLIRGGVFGEKAD